MTQHNLHHTFETQAIHAGEIPDEFGAHVAPIYQTSTFVFDSMDKVDAYQAGQPQTYLYSRSKNPTREALASKLAALEGYNLIRAADGDSSVVRAEVFSSGMAAISAAILGSAKAGDHVIALDVLYGTTDHLLREVLPHYGISVTYEHHLSAERLTVLLAQHPNTTVVYLETPANPTIDLVDISAVSGVAHDHGVVVIVDNTFATPVLQRPLEFGADVVVHSTTKYINGHGTVIGGAFVSNNLPLFTERIQPLIRSIGGVPSAFDCWLTTIGLKTLPLRMREHCANAMQVAQFLQNHPAVEVVHYPGLKSFPQHELACRQMDDFGAMLAFEIAGGYEAGRQMIEHVQLCRFGVSLGTVDTLIQHPASMTHAIVPKEEKAKKGVSDSLIRLSVGLESATDIIADLDQALGSL